MLCRQDFPAIITSKPICLNRNLTGILFAVLATLVWAGNFVIARGATHMISPVALSFFRWITACIFLAPFCLSRLPLLIDAVKKRPWYFFWISFTGISLFNTFVYIAGQYSSAINLALIGTTSSPIFSIILASVFLKEKLGVRQYTGLIICILGILVLLSQGSISRLLHFQLTVGDAWILVGALLFAVYNILVRKKPVDIRGIDFLFITFLLGTLFLIPFFFIEQQYAPAIQWSWSLIGIFLYLGLGASVIAFLSWNIAIARLGAGKASLFGNLIPVFSALEAMLILNEQLSLFQAIGGLVVIFGLFIANISIRKKA